MIEQGRSRGRAEAWRPWIAARRRPALAWPQGLTDFARRTAQRVREWAAVEAAPGRLVPWLAIGFGIGTIIYFAIDREPAVSAAALLLAATVAAAILCRRRPVAFPACVGLAAVAAGFATGAIKREIIVHPVLSAPAWNVDIAGFVEVREERERSDRVVVRVARMSGARLTENLERVRVSVRKGTAPAVGTFIEFKARLSRRSNPCGPAAMTSRGTCISSASARPDSCWAQSARSRPRMCRAYGCVSPSSSTACARPSTSASARFCPATTARSLRP